MPESNYLPGSWTDPGAQYMAVCLTLTQTTVTLGSIAVNLPPERAKEWFGPRGHTELSNAIVKLTPEARLEWRLSGKAPQIESPNSPHIAELVMLRDFGDTGDDFWMTLERLNGRTD